MSWKFNSDASEYECKDYVNQTLNQMLQRKSGLEFDSFTTQIDIVKLKEKKHLIHLATFSKEEVFPYVGIEEKNREYQVGDKTYSVKMNSDRYLLFKNNSTCVSCGLIGEKLILDLSSDGTAHFNLYAEENGGLVLMTKDHELAKSNGGANKLDNYRTMCQICNNVRGNYDLTFEQIRELRNLVQLNPDHLSRKDLWEKISNLREEFHNNNR